MVSLSRSRRLTADDVEGEYRIRIEALLDQYDPRPKITGVFRANRTFDDLIRWVQRTLGQKHHAERSVEFLNSQLDSANTEIGRLRSRLDETESQLRERTGERNEYRRELDNIRADHEHQMRVTASGYENQLEEQRTNLTAKINVLSDDIMIAQADSRAWTDEKLKKKFADMRLLIDQLTSPHTTGSFRGSPAVRAEIDPEGFLDRGSMENSHFLLRKALWDIIFEYFFSSPFGFGAFGPGAGKAALVALYGSWRGVFGEADYNGSSISEVFSEGRREANNWRSSTFESIMASVIEGGSGGSDAYPQLLDTYESNAAACGDEIWRVLGQVSGRPLNDKSRDSIAKLSRAGAELGLQFGVQPSHMQLIRPAHRETVEIGKNFVDCVDNVMRKGDRVQVDIYVSPGLTRVGNGKKDFHGSMVIVPCSVYPISR